MKVTRELNIEGILYRELENYPYYFISEEGEVYSKRSNGIKNNSYDTKLKILKKARDRSGKGYYFVSIYNKKIEKCSSINVHKLVALAFLDFKPTKGLTVSHLDGNKLNNKSDNLVIETQVDNLARKKKHGTHDNGYNNSRAYLNKEQLYEMRNLIENTDMTQKAIGELFNVNATFVGKVKRKERYGNV